ncbi:MAG TPA: HupE/UreJ family protein [Methylomirabilota bacterium]|nr:HupE/UreJ family protein [Methylomirabilota bacterium]
MIRAGLVALIALIAAPLPPAAAHEVRPGLLQLTESEPDRFEMLWRVPARGDLSLALRPRLPETCRSVGVPERRTDGARAEERRTVDCDGGLAGREIAIEGLAGVRTDVLVRAEYLNGSSETLRASPEAPAVTLFGRRSILQVAVTYLALGFEHILLGVDHLLFVTALMLLVSGWGRLIGTVTAFTLAHSITLAGATLGLVTAPSGLIEALIALSIAVVAAEVVFRDRGETGIAIKRPWLIAFGFGLLHGFGFAGALSDVGIPAHAVPTALLFFNLGVEAGQIAFIAVLLFAARGLAMLGAQSLPAWRPSMAYGIGTVAAIWAAERTVAIWS